jgi:hypothetical protein
MGLKLSRTHRRGLRRSVALTSVFSLLFLYLQFLLAIPASADPPPFTGGFSPTIFGLAADLNGDDAVTGRDDANTFYGDTHIIDGELDCNNWESPNDGTAGDGVIDGGDDCTLIGYDGTADGVTITVTDGAFASMDGVAIPDGTRLPTVFNAADPDNNDVGDSDFAWSAIDGKVDSNGNEAIDSNGDDCHLGLIGVTVDAGLGDPRDGADILGTDSVTGINPCTGLAGADSSFNGFVDLNSDGTITAADTCDDCFFGHQVEDGLVQQIPPLTLELTPPADTNEQGTSHTVTAHLEDGDGDPVPGVTVFFFVDGANDAEGSDVTDANGDATFTYTGTNSGADTIEAFADLNGSGFIDEGEPADAASKAWEPGSGPDPSSQAPNRLDAFVRGTDDQLYQKTWNGSTWSNFIPLGGVLTSDPAAVSWADGRIDVFVRGTDNQLWHKWFADGGWSAWEPLGGVLTSAPDVASWAPNRLDVFARGTDNQLWHKWWNGSAWSGYEPLGGELNGGPGSVSWDTNRIDVFVRGTDNQLWHKWWNGLVWSGYEPLGGVLASDPDPASWAPNRIDVFVRGTDNQLWHRWWDGTSWQGYEPLEGVLTSSPGAVSWSLGRIDVFVRGTDGALWHKWFSAGAWSGWESLGGQLK